MKKIIVVSLALTFCYWLNAQSLTRTKSFKTPLKVGDTVSNIVLQKIVNYPTNTAKFSDFKGKIVILDFWNTYCASCIGSWPKLLSLQKEFNSDIQIILVNPTQSFDLVKPLFEKSKKVKNVDMKLPSVCGDSTIRQMFAYQSVPHIVWIDRQGIVRAISGGDQLSSRNITAMLNNNPSRISPKIENDEYIRPDFKKPLFINGNGGNVQDVLFQSILTKRTPYLWPASTLVAEKEIGYYSICSSCSIQDLYTLAFARKVNEMGFVTPLPYNRVILEVEDSTKYLGRIHGELQPQNLFTYQLISPPTSRARLQELMQADLDRFFNMHAQWEKRKVKCYVLTASDTAFISYKGGLINCYVRDGEGSVGLNKVSVGTFINSLETATNYFFSPFPIIDETGLKGMLGGIKFEANILDPRELDKALQKYKMGFKLEERDVEMLVIRENITSD